MIKQFVQQFRLTEGHGLDHRIVLAALAFHHVGSQGPWSTNEAQHSGFVADALAQATQHFADEGHGFAWIQRAQCVDLIDVANRLTDLRALAFNDVEVDAHAGQRCEDVGEENHAIRLESSEGLHRDLIGEIRVLGAFAKAGVLISQVAVDLHIPAGLTHHPDRRTLHRFTTGCTQQQRQRVAHQAEIRSVGNLPEESMQKHWIPGMLSGSSHRRQRLSRSLLIPGR